MNSKKTRQSNDKVKLNKSIEIVVTYIDGLNLMPKRTCEMVYKVLDEHYATVRITTINKKTDLEDLVKRAPDLVFSAIKCVGFTNSAVSDDSEQDIWLSEYLDKAGIKYTGSNKKALKLELSKSNAKLKVIESNISTAPFFTAKPNQYKKGEDLPISFPLFVKPLYQGAGNGIDDDSIAHNFNDYEKKVEAIFREFEAPALVEKYLSGREFTVGIIADGLGDFIEMPLEVIAAENSAGYRILDKKGKNDDSEETIYIADDKIRRKISTLARQAFKALGARDLGRIDIRMDEEGIPYFLEANLVPGLSTGYFFRACQINEEMSYETMILKIAKLGLGRVTPTHTAPY